MMKTFITYLSSLILFCTITTTHAQVCTMTASTSVNAVCFGNPVTLTAESEMTYAANQFFDFNQSQIPQGWSTTGATNYSANICGTSMDNTPYFWASTVQNGAVPQIVTADFDVCSGGRIEFEMRYAVQGAASPCEGPDEEDEGVSLEYSLDGGITWIEFVYYQPDGVVLVANPGFSNLSIVNAGQATPFTNWRLYSVPIPAAAISTSTRFRWVQRFSSGGCCDNWGLDNIGVYAGPCITTHFSWNNGMTADSFAFTPTRDTCFTATLYDVNNNALCSDNVCITVNPVYATSTNVSICQGDTYMFGPTASALLPYTNAGSYPVTFRSRAGCDSVVTLNLSVIPPKFDTIAATICSGRSYAFGPNNYTASGQYSRVVQAQSGCDSTVTVNLTVTPPIEDTMDVTVCFGGSYTLGATTYTASGTYRQAFVTPGGCDSNMTVNLTVSPQITSSVNAAICQGDTYTLGTQSLTTGGNYQEIFTAADGCDSTVSLALTVNPVYTGTRDTAICQGDSLFFGGRYYSTAGAHLVNFQTINGCDSLITLNLTYHIIPPPFAGNDLVLCSDQTGNLGGPAAANIGYSWSPAIGLSNASISDPTVSIHSLVPQTLTYVVTASYFQCRAYDSVNVTIVPYPVVNIQPVAPQCYEGNSFSFTGGNAFLPGAQFNWSMPAATPSGGTVQSPSGVHFRSPGTHPVIFTVAHGACSASDTLDVVVHPEPNAAFSLPAPGCMPLSLQIQNTSTPAGVTSFWLLGNGQTSTASSPNVTYNTAGTYDISLVVTSVNGCPDSVSYPGAVTVYPLPQAGFSANPREVYQDEAHVYVTGTAVGAHSWYYEVANDADYITPNFVHQFYDTGYHYIRQVVTSIHGCTDEITDRIHVLPASTLYIPNAFTPGNRDEMNATFGAYGNFVEEFHMIIFDRWGSKVFESRDMNERWDGTIRNNIIKQDLYVYKITYLDHRKNPQELHGHVVLVR